MHAARIKDLEASVSALDKAIGTERQRIRDLESVAIGQAAMIACLTGLLMKNGSLEPELATLIPVAGMSPPPGLSPKKIQQWLKDQVEEFAADKRG